MWKAEGQSQLWTGWFKLSEHVRCVTFVSQSVTVFLLSPVCVCHRWFLGLNRSSSKIGPVVVHLLNLTRYGLLSLYLSTPASDLRPAGLDELFDQITKKTVWLSFTVHLFLFAFLSLIPYLPVYLFSLSSPSLSLLCQVYRQTPKQTGCLPLALSIILSLPLYSSSGSSFHLPGIYRQVAPCVSCQ